MQEVPTSLISASGDPKDPRTNVVAREIVDIGESRRREQLVQLVRLDRILEWLSDS